MNKFTLYILGFFILTQVSALACNFKIANFGSPKENIKIEPHIHAFNLPMNFSTNEDKFSSYSHKEQTDLLMWAKEFFANLGVNSRSKERGSCSQLNMLANCCYLILISLHV